MLDEIKWIVSGQILGIQFSGRLARAHMYEMNDVAMDLLNREGRPPAAHVIIDVSQVTHYERDMMSVELLHNVVERHPLVDWIVVVDPHPNAILRFVGMTLISLMRFRYHVTKTHADATAFLMPKLSHTPQQ